MKKKILLPNRKVSRNPNLTNRPHGQIQSAATPFNSADSEFKNIRVISNSVIPSSTIQENKRNAKVSSHKSAADDCLSEHNLKIDIVSKKNPKATVSRQLSDKKRPEVSGSNWIRIQSFHSSEAKTGHANSKSSNTTNCKNVFLQSKTVQLSSKVQPLLPIDSYQTAFTPWLRHNSICKQIPQVR